MPSGTAINVAKNKAEITMGRVIPSRVRISPEIEVW